MVIILALVYWNTKVVALMSRKIYHTCMDSEESEGDKAPVMLVGSIIFSKVAPFLSFFILVYWHTPKYNVSFQSTKHLPWSIKIKAVLLLQYLVTIPENIGLDVYLKRRGEKNNFRGTIN